MALGCLFLLALPLAAAISYPAPTFVNVGSQPTYIVVADFNGDCAPDFATVNIGSMDVTVRFGDGTGAFPTMATTGGFTSPQYVALGDFNEDGHPDLAVGNRSNFSDPANTVFILLNNGSGSFTIQTPHLALGTDFPQGIVVGDFNEDGHQDVMVGGANGTNSLSLFLGDGAGNFGAPSHPTITTTSGGSVADITAGDWNGDGHLDLAVASFYDVIWITGNGNGTFNVQTSFTFPNSQGEGGAVDITAADIDHDGDIDVATAGGNVVAGASVFINNGSGSFTWHQMSMPQAPANPVFVALADLDGDGNRDIVTSDQSGCTPWGSNLAARPGNGDGTFGAAVPVSIGYGPTCINSHWQPQELGIADLNCDGKADIISANMATGFCSVLITTGGGSDTTAPVLTVPPPVTASAGPSCSATVPNIGTATATDNCSSCVVINRSGVPAGNIYPLGTTTITYTASDGHGNTSTGTQTVTVVDDTPPVVTPPADVTALCNGSVNPGTATATDNCPGVTVSGVRSDAQPLNAAYPLGTTTITWTANDAHGNSASATQSVTVTPNPVVIGSASASPNSLWPPNHKMVDVTIARTTSGGCGAVACTITSITSNEPDNGLGDGDTANDTQIVDATHVKLRAERSGGGSGRVYTITISCTDGNTTATKTVTVTVPHNK
jgi:hypothetical protein